MKNLMNALFGWLKKPKTPEVKVVINAKATEPVKQVQFTESVKREINDVVDKQVLVEKQKVETKPVETKPVETKKPKQPRKPRTSTN